MPIIESFYLHYDPELWRVRNSHTWWRQLAARYLPSFRYGGWLLADTYGEFVTYAEKPGPQLDAKAAQAAASENLDCWTYPHMPRSRWTPRDSGRGVEQYEIAVVVAGDEPGEGTVLRSARFPDFSYVRADTVVLPGEPSTHRWFATWTDRHGEQVAHPEGQPWAGLGAPIGQYGPRVGEAMSLEERHGPFELGDPALYEVVVAEITHLHDTARPLTAAEVRGAAQPRERAR